MKINCDYCGAQIDTDKFDTCPSCGGIYSHDPEVLAEKAKLARADELFMEQKQLENDRMRLENNQHDDLNAKANVNKAATAGCVSIVILLAVLGFVFIMLFFFAMTEEIADSGSGNYNSGNASVVTSQTRRTEEPEVTTSTKRISISYSISLEPIEIPEIPEINIPDILAE